MISPAVPSLVREINERRTIEILRAKGALHAAEIARLIGLSRTTMAEILRELVEAGLVQEYTPGEEDSRRAKSVFEAVSDLKVSLAIDIGARFIRAAICDLNLVIRSEANIEVKNSDLASILIDIKSAVRLALKESNFKRKDIAAICVAAPGIIHQDGVISIAGALPSLDGFDLKAFISKEYGIAPRIENDVNMLTIAEQKIGLGRERKNFAVLSIGSGLGSGLVLNGDLHRGHNGAAGEVFWVPFGDPRDKRRESTNPSGDSIADIARKLRKTSKKSTLKEPYSMIEIIAAAKEGDLLGKAIVAEVAERIALYAGAISAITDVELIILSGGIGRQANFFLTPIKELLKEVLPVSPQLLVSSLGADAILIGALQMATIDACEFTFLDRRKFTNRDVAVSDIG